MLSIKVLGSGCANCKRLEAETRAALDAAGVTYDLLKVTDYADIMAYGIMSTPGLVINEKVISAGRIPKRRQVSSLKGVLSLIQVNSGTLDSIPLGPSLRAEFKESAPEVGPKSFTGLAGAEVRCD